MKLAALLLCFLSGCCVQSCLEPPAGHTTFGSDLPSRDGKTWLTVAKSGVGPGCILELDGRPWSTLDARTPVTPGKHTVGCRDAESLELDITSGHEVVVDYWGP